MRELARSLSKSLAGLARVVVFTPHLPWEHYRDVPVMCADSVLVDNHGIVSAGGTAWMPAHSTWTPTRVSWPKLGNVTGRLRYGFSPICLVIGYATSDCTPDKLDHLGYELSDSARLDTDGR